MKTRDYLIVFIGFVTAVLLLFFAQSTTKPFDLSSVTQDTFSACLADTKKDVVREKGDAKDYVLSWNLCARQLYDNLARDDFAIRREKFRRQELDERVNMWLVVFITLSGVVLASLQLLMSYKIALSGKEHWSSDSELAVEQGKISYKTSVTGLAILALSLAFFGVYVRYIYNQAESGAPLYPPAMFPSGEQLPTGIIIGSKPIERGDTTPTDNAKKVGQ